MNRPWEAACGHSSLSWAFSLVGIGLYAIAFPVGGALTLIFFFAFALMLAGIDRLVLAGSGWPGPGTPRWVSYFSFIAGIFAVVVGFVALLYPGFGERYSCS